MKHLLIILLTLASLTTNANAVSEGGGETECVPSYQLTQKQGNMTTADIGMVLKPCHGVLDARAVISNLDQFATKDDIRFFKSMIKEMTHEYQMIEDAMSETNSLTLLFYYLTWISASCITIFLIVLAIASYNNNEVSKGAKILLIVGVALLASANITKIQTYATLITLGELGRMNYTESDIDTYNEVRNADFSKLVSASSKSNSKILTALKYNSIQNVATNFHLKETMGGIIDIDATLLGDESNVYKPTEGEFRYYQNHCEQTNFGMTDKEFSFLIANFNFSNIPNAGHLLSGGDTSEYNCSDHYGKLTNAISVSSRAIEATDRFMLGMFGPDMGKKLNWLDSLIASFNGTVGGANLVLEKTAEVASNGVEIIPSQIQLALDAVKSTNTEYDAKDTDSYRALIESQKSRMGNVYENNKIEDMSAMQEVALNNIQSQLYKSASIFGHSPKDGEELDFVEDKFAIGFYYISSFLDDTSRLVLERDCIKTDSKNYPFRVKYASYYNAIDNDTPHHTTGHYGGVSGAHCYKYKGKLIAGANPADLPSITKEIEQRDLALRIFMESFDQASMELIMNKKGLNDDLLVDFLNTLDTTFQSTSDSYLVLTKIKQELIQIFNAVDDSFSVKYHTEEIIEDINYPATYYNFNKFYDNVYQQDLDQIAKNSGLRFFDLQDYFNTDIKSYLDSEDSKAVEAEGVMQALLTPKCPVIDENGDCRANIIQILKQNYETILAVAEGLTIYKFSIDLVDGGCSTFQNIGSGSGTLKMGSAKGGPWVMAFCGSMSGLDSVNEVIVSPALTIAWVLVLGTKIGLLIPAFADIFVLVISFTQFYIPTIIIPLMFSFEICRNIVFYLSDVSDKEAFNRLTDFKATIGGIKVFAWGIIGTLLATLLAIWLYTSEGLGGGISDALSKNIDAETAITVLLVYFILMIVVSIAVSIKFIPSIVFKAYEQSMSYFKIEAGKTSDSYSAFGSYAMGYLTSKAFDDTAKMQRPLNSVKGSLKNKVTKMKNSSKSNVALSKDTNNKVKTSVVEDEKDVPIKEKNEDLKNK